MKKLLVIMLAMVLVIALAVPAMANNGKGKGLVNAPGQAENFSKGITTVVTNEDVTIKDFEISYRNVVSDPVDKEEEFSIVGEPKVTTTIEKHNIHDWYRTVTITTTTTTYYRTTWTETTTVTETLETPVTITGVTTTTLSHRGAPGSNGEVLINESVFAETNRVYGDAEVTNVSEPVVTKSERTTIELGKVDSVITTVSGWGTVKP